MDLADPRIALEDPGIIVTDNEYDAKDDDNDDDDSYHNHGHDLPYQLADHRSEEGDEHNKNEQSVGDSQDKQNEDNNHTEQENIRGENVANLMGITLNQGQEVGG